MKQKIAFILLLFLLLCTVRVIAADTQHEEFSNILNDAIAERGAFDGRNGVIYSSLENFYFENEMLLICSVEDSALTCSVYGVNDGAECIDTLTLDMAGDTTFSVIIYESMSYLLLEHSGGNPEYFALLDDSFTHVPEITYSEKTEIVRFRGGKADTLSNTPQELYNFLNSLRLETISAYPYMNKVNVISSDMRAQIRDLLAACASLTEFDRENYDYDRIFKYVLFTHESFIPLTALNPHSGENDGIKTVSSEFIDYVMSVVLGIEPEHPPVTALTERGFCYREGMYMYTGGFSADYSTEIIDLLAVHDLGAGIYHVIFSDIYYENGVSVPEYSYAIIDNGSGPMSLVKLGMGKNLLTAHQISRYSAASEMMSPAWEIPEADVQEENRKFNGTILAAALAALFAAIAVVWWRLVLRKNKYPPA